MPYLAALPLQAAGLEKYRSWQQVWALQRREDAGEKVEIQVPPKYSDRDFLKAGYWRARGKLDVPKERFMPTRAWAATATDPGDRLGGLGPPRAGLRRWPGRCRTSEALGAGDEQLDAARGGAGRAGAVAAPVAQRDRPAFGTSPAAAIRGLSTSTCSALESTRERGHAWRPPRRPAARASQAP